MNFLLTVCGFKQLPTNKECYKDLKSVNKMDSRMQDSHKSFLIKDLLGDVLRPGAATALGMSSQVVVCSLLKMHIKYMTPPRM